MNKDRDMLLVIDANAIVHRAFHAYPSSLTTSTGVQDNAVYGFTTMLLQSLKQFNPKYVVCAFDTSAKTFRHAQFTDYKAQRKPTDESLNAQFPLVKEVLEAFNIPYIEKDGYEADDIIGTISEWARSGKWKMSNLDVCVITGDRDLLQLIGDNVYVALPSGSFSTLSVYDTEKVIEKYGYYPKQVTDYKGIVGDASDNIPGVKGVGEKTALSLLHRYGSLDEIYRNMNEVEGRYQKKLSEGVEQAYFSKELATIKRDVDVNFQLEDCLLVDFDEKKLLDVFRKFEFKSLVNKIPRSINNVESGEPQLDMFTSSGVAEEVVVVKEVESITSQLKVSDRVVLVYLSDDYILCGFVDKKGEVMFNNIYVDNLLKSVVDNLYSCETYFWGWEDAVSQNDGLTNLVEVFNNIVDIQLLAYNLSSGRKDYSLGTVVFDYLGEKVDIDNRFEVGKQVVRLLDELMSRAKELVFSDYVVDGFRKLSDSLKVEVGGVANVVSHLEVPVSIVLSKMEKRGIAVDKDELEKLRTVLEGEIDAVKSDIYRDIGHEINLNSPKQLSEVIYNELDIPDSLTGKRSRSTREEVLLQMKDIHPAISNILKYRELTKVLNTYVTPYLDIILDSKSDEIHTDFKQMGASSGRFASINPNMQNIPIRSEWGDRIRRVFVPRNGYIFLGADYSQIEFRIMADISQDPVLLEDFAEGRDIHSATASRVFKVGIEDVTKEQRSLGKTINFAILFGQTQFGLASLMGVDRNEAQRYIDEYFNTYKGVKKYIDNATKDALDRGFVQSMFGRTRVISGLTSRNFNVRNAAVREAVNMPIQGGEADIMKVAMVKIDRLIKEKYLDDAYMLLQVHDEIIFEVKEGLVDQFGEEVRDIMSNAVQLSVPLEVHISKGSNMSELK